MRPEKMRVQLVLEELADEVNRLYPLVAPRNAHAADHLRRSVQSGLWNCAEAIAAWNPNIKVHVYEISRRETNEVRAILRFLVRQGVLTWAQVRRAYNLAGCAIMMLIKASRSVENGKGR